MRLKGQKRANKDDDEIVGGRGTLILRQIKQHRSKRTSAISPF